MRRHRPNVCWLDAGPGCMPIKPYKNDHPDCCATKVTASTAAQTNRARPRGLSTGSHAQAERHDRRPASADSGISRPSGNEGRKAHEGGGGRRAELERRDRDHAADQHDHRQVDEPVARAPADSTRERVAAVLASRTAALGFPDDRDPRPSLAIGWLAACERPSRQRWQSPRWLTAVGRVFLDLLARLGPVVGDGLGDGRRRTGRASARRASRRSRPGRCRPSPPARPWASARSPAARPGRRRACRASAGRSPAASSSTPRRPADARRGRRRR